MQIAVGSVLAPVTVLERQRHLPVGELGHLGERLLAIVRMDEVHERYREQLIDRIAQHPGERRIHPPEEPLRVRDTEQVDREVEEALQIIELIGRAR